MNRIKQCMIAVFILFQSSMAFAQEVIQKVYYSKHNHAEAAIWLFANISYAGMRAQNHPSVGWRVLSFIFGFPGTLLSYFVVKEGSERMYGIEIPKKR